MKNYDELRKLAEASHQHYAATQAHEPRTTEGMNAWNDFCDIVNPAKVIDLLDAMDAQAQRIAELEATISSQDLGYVNQGFALIDMERERNAIRAELDALSLDREDTVNDLADHINVVRILREELDALKSRETGAWYFADEDVGHVSFSTTPPTEAQIAYLSKWNPILAWQPLCIAPVAPAQPAQDVNAMLTFAETGTQS